MKTRTHTAALLQNSEKKTKVMRCTAIMAGAFLLPFLVTQPAMAANITQGISSLTELVYSIFKGIGMIWGAFGVFEFAKSFPSHNPSERNMGIVSIVCGILLINAKSIMEMFI